MALPVDVRRARLLDPLDLPGPVGTPVHLDAGPCEASDFGEFMELSQPGDAQRTVRLSHHEVDELAHQAHLAFLPW